jgi:CHAT domain-containing protein
VANQFRRFLQTPATRQYRRSAEQLYRWLIEPIEASLAAAGIDTLVFVPDGTLRTIPFAALHDGEGFLIERFAVATTMGLTISTAEPLEPDGARFLMAGISQARDGFQSLDQVPEELGALHEIYGGTLLLDEQFRIERFEEEIVEGRPQVVHLATHAVFGDEPNSSFLLAYDGRISLSRLSELIRATRFRDDPLELLTLSACETALGDEQAALGLTGVAIRSGARSAIGSLWRVPDRGTASLMTKFYRSLGRPGMTKAKALQEAQNAMIADREHPFQWSAFLLVSNWL